MQIRDWWRVHSLWYLLRTRVLQSVPIAHLQLLGASAYHDQLGSSKDKRGSLDQRKKKVGRRAALPVCSTRLSERHQQKSQRGVCCVFRQDAGGVCDRDPELLRFPQVDGVDPNSETADDLQIQSGSRIASVLRHGVSNGKKRPRGCEVGPKK